MGVRTLTDFAIEKWELYNDEEFKQAKETVKTPPWMVTGKNLIGTQEIKGKKHNKVILDWAKGLDGWVKNYYKKDEIAWCGLFVAHCLKANGVDISNIKNVLSARAWAKLGKETEPQFGAIMVFWRKSQSSGLGHVGFYVAEDAKYYHILGGNQRDAVNVIKMPKSRFLEARWPKRFKTLHELNKGRLYKRFDGKVFHDND